MSDLRRTVSIFHTLLCIVAVPLFCSSGMLEPRCHAAEAEPADKIILSDAIHKKCLTVLRKAFHSDEFWPSMHAAEALSLTGHGNEVRLFLEPKLKTETDDQHRCGLAREMVRAGDRARASIMLNILEGDDPHGHVHAAESLYKVNEIGNGKAMRAAMAQQENFTQALMAAAALGRWGNPEAFALLRKHLSNEDESIARISAWVLARIGDSSDIPALQKNLERVQEPLSKLYFVNALATLGDEKGQAALVKNLQSEDPAVRTYSAVFAGEARILCVKDRLIELLDDDNVDVRVRSAQTLLVLSQKQSLDSQEAIVRDVYPATAKNPRYSEGSVIGLRNGDLLYATTEFIGSGSDHAKARIIARTSNDGGRSWSEPHVMQKNIGSNNVMSVTLRFLGEKLDESTPLALFYLVKNDLDDLKTYLKISTDQGQTFGKPILVTSGEGYHVMNNDRITRLSSGRLLAPVAWTADVRKVNHFISFCFFSDDNGLSWNKAKGSVDYSKRGAMEPEVIELNDSRVLMIVRTQSGHIASSYSKDAGETWSQPTSWGVRAPEAPATLRRIPSTGDLLLIWNDTYSQGKGHGGRRTPLTAAISSDDGKTWQLKKQIETDPNHAYAYTSLMFHQGRAILSYYVQKENGQISSRFRSLPISWFYKPAK